MRVGLRKIKSEIDGKRSRASVESKQSASEILAERVEKAKK